MKRTSSIRIVLGNGSLARYPQGGGHWTVRIQYLMGLTALGHDVFLLERLRSTDNPDEDHRLIHAFFQRLEQYGFRDKAALLLFDSDWTVQNIDSATAYGKTTEQIKDVIRSADLFWNDCGHIRQPLLGMFRRRALIDLDPGSLQVSTLAVNTDLYDHHSFFTVGGKMTDADCEAPTLGVKWHTFIPFVHLPLWKVTPDPGPEAPFTSVTHWTWGKLQLQDRELSTSKRTAYLKYAELPRRAGRAFELAANIHSEGPAADDSGDRELLENNGWKLVDPWKVADSPSTYQGYISRSRAEISCPKPIFRELKTGWFSDRSVCYLASGRPVLAEDTGFSDYLPVGNGLLAFRNMSEAVEGVAEIDSDYRKHMNSARELAQEFMNSDRSLVAMLEASL